MANSLWPHGLQHARFPCPLSLGVCSNHVHWGYDAIQPTHLLSPSSPPALNLSQNRDLFQWVGSLHQVAKVLHLVMVMRSPVLANWCSLRLGFHFPTQTRIQRVVLVAHSCLTLWNPMDSSRPGFSVHGILQARVQECVSMPSSRGSSWSRDWTASLMSPPSAGGSSKLRGMFRLSWSLLIHFSHCSKIVSNSLV